MKNIVLSLMIFFGSCSYKDYIVLTDEYKAGTYNNDKTQFSFFKFYRIYQPAKGLAAFPDGGQPKILYQGVFLYLYDIPLNKLRLVHSFEGLKGLRSSWSKWIYFDEKNKLFFSVYPPSHYKFQKAYFDKNQAYIASRGIFSFNLEDNKIIRISDVAETPQVSPDRKKIIYVNYLSDEPEIYLMDKNGENNKFMDKGFNPLFSPQGNYLSYIYESDSVMYDIKVMDFENNEAFKIKTIKNINKYSIYWLNNHQLCFEDVGGKKKKYDIKNKKISEHNEKKAFDRSMEISISDIKKYTNNITYGEWGIKIQKCCPKSKKEIIEAIVDTEKGDKDYRKAILQEIENELSVQDISNLLKQIEEHKKELQGINKTKYEGNIEKTVEHLKKLLKTKNYP